MASVDRVKQRPCGTIEDVATVLYEYPFNEGIRTMLRLEHLFDRLHPLVTRDHAIDHHFALVTLFEIVDVASRADLKSDLLKELERHRLQFQGYRGNPHVAEAALDDVIGRIESAHTGLNQLQGKAGQALAGNEWLTSIRSRISIPGGTCAFDLPAYYAWQQLAPEARRDDLARWVATVHPLDRSLRILLGLLRDSGARQRVAAPGGQYQQSLPQGRTYHLLRVKLDAQANLVPEITGHRLMVSVRFMRPDGDARLRPSHTDTSFELTLCA